MPSRSPLNFFWSALISGWMDICARCERIWISDSGISSRRKKMVKMTIASAAATPGGMKPLSGVAIARRPASSGWTMSGFQMGSRKFTGEAPPSWHGVVPAAAKWLTASKPARGEPGASGGAVALDRRVGVARAARLEAAAAAGHRWTDRVLVGADREQQGAPRPVGQAQREGARETHTHSTSLE